MTDDERWEAVLARDASADGAFVYAVRSTGVFCRPSCSSRRPRRDRVAFYDIPEAAIRAGFRACRRCRPGDADATDPRLAVVRRLCRLMESSEGGLPTLAELGAEVGLSPAHLQRSFKAALGISPRQYADAIRVTNFKAALRGGEAVTPALYGAGYGSSSRLYENAPEQLGMTPASYAKGGAGARITFTLVELDTSGELGWLLVAATERGLCMVALGDSPSFLEDELRAEYPAADFARDDVTLAEWSRGVAALVEGNPPHRDLPIDVRATAFQRQVWERLRRIPAGTTLTYGEIAAELGKPSAARAVGRACATNPVAVVVPCHRAVGSDGALHGYRWGLERKRALLSRESRADGGIMAGAGRCRPDRRAGAGEPRPSAQSEA